MSDIQLGIARKTPPKLLQWIDRWRGREVEYDLRPYLKPLRGIHGLEQELERDSEQRLQERAEELRQGLRAGASKEGLLEQVFALVREASRRVLGMRHFDVQLIGGMALHQGKLIEMETGEGKTLVATLPAVLHAFGGETVHVLTFNDYLARRDAEWMGPLYQFLGLEVAYVEAGMVPQERHRAYRADIVYLTAKQAGFDLLRDGLRYDEALRVHHELSYAIVDEADSILIDEARIPLVIAGNRDAPPHNAHRMAALAQSLEPTLHFDSDQTKRNVYLTEEGLRRVERELGCGPLHEADNADWLAGIRLAIHAKELLRRDVDYIVRDGKLELVDEFTGRVVPDRQWPDGLQAALEAKESLKLGKEGQVLDTITLQHFLKLYPKLAGMSATIRPEQEEFLEFYELPLVVLPPNKPCGRVDLPDRIYTHKEARYKAMLAAIVEAHGKGRPILIGTASVRESEELAQQLRDEGFAPEVLNAKNDALEAAIIAEAGAAGAITISTNMAGRGTDILLGGKEQSSRAAVVAAGGLYVVGTNRHESRRIDRQLRGRAGRQGDPGSSEFFISLEDEVLVRYGIRDILPEAHRTLRDEPLTHPIVAQRTRWAQRVIEGQNFDIRRTLGRYTTLIEYQRRFIRQWRDELLDANEDDGSPFWQEADPSRYQELLDFLGQAQALHLERQCALFCIEKCWVEHLLKLTQIRESIYMVRLGNQNPLQEYLKATDLAFQELLSAIDEAMAERLDGLELSKQGLSLEHLGIKGPSSTWTYMVDDNPLREALGLQVANSLTLSLGAAIWAPLYILVALYKRFFKTPKKDRL